MHLISNALSPRNRLSGVVQADWIRLKWEQIEISDDDM